ncbi:MAG: hypothetical protein MI924_27665 [Chloroflexales bacterium]|nr:hypothetical protein [Chloroflexales bacterium]
MTHSMRTLILRADAIPLAFFGLSGITMDLLGYFAGIGAWKDVFLNNPLAIGAVEAHGLAIIIAVLLIRHAAAQDTTTWHVTAVAVHLLLGICNLVFWQVFIDVAIAPIGVVATAYHFVFIIANGAALFLTRLSPEIASAMPKTGE